VFDEIASASSAGLESPFDAAVIGGGVVGCAMARRFALEGARVILLEKASDILNGASKGNSALLHTGFDAPHGSLELACVRAGYQEYMDVRERLNLPLLRTGAAVVAWTADDAARLAAIEDRARANGIDDVRRLSRTELFEREPHLAPTALEGLLVPGESVIDPWSAPLAYLRQAIENGAQARFRFEVESGRLAGGLWRLSCSGATVSARIVINCAGLYGDLLEQKLLGGCSFSIRPRKGQFVVFDKAAARYIRTTILPVPTERTKGLLVARTIFGNVLAGPTAEDQESRTDATVDNDTLRSLVRKACSVVPALEDVPVTAVYAGLRPATEHKDYQVRFDRERQWITVGGIRSTGLTSALGLARHVYGLYAGSGAVHTPVAQPLWSAVPNLAEDAPRDWEQPGYGEIVCHCELATLREIQSALEGPLPARDYGGLRRRTRAGMGRCQGFYCSGRLAQLTEGRLDDPLAVGRAHE
jgi:glycerol-3-phosphate dehydrogenase